MNEEAVDAYFANEAVACRQTLRLSNELFTLIVAGFKKCTLRKGERDIKLGELLFISTEAMSEQYFKEWLKVPGTDGYFDGGNSFIAQLVDVRQVIIKRLLDFTDEELSLDGFENKLQALESMRRFYPDLELYTPMTMIYFEVVT